MIRLVCIMVAALVCVVRPAYADTYSDLRTGQLRGKLTVQWLEPDVFLFIPDQADPLVFERSNGEKILPGRMLTDGGSVPRPLWAFRSYSPWGYAPAFIVHDWLFHIKHCRIGDFERYDLRTAADVMGEIIKTMMERGSTDRDPMTVNVMHTAVTSIFARRLWEAGACLPPPAAFSVNPIAEYVLSFP